MDNVDQEIAELQQQFAEEQAEKSRALKEAYHARRVAIREEVRNGQGPDHIRSCAQCLRAVLLLDPKLACSEGQRFVNMWK